MHYISMIDQFMSGWGLSKDKTNVLVFECASKEEAYRVMDYARQRGDMTKVAYWKKEMPTFDPEKFFVQVKNRDIYPRWYE